MKKFLVLIATVITSCSIFEMPHTELGPGDYLPADLESYGDYQCGTTLVVFFNPECPDCHNTLPVVDSVLKGHPSLKVIAFGRDMTRAETDAFSDTASFSFPICPDPDRKMYHRFTMSVIPRCYLALNNRILDVWDDKDTISVESANAAFKNKF